MINKNGSLKIVKITHKREQKEKKNREAEIRRNRQKMKNKGRLKA